MALFLKAQFKRRGMSRDQLEVLFKEYEAAFDKLDLKAISGYCADSFILAGPKGSITQSPKEFEKNREMNQQTTFIIQEIVLCQL